MRPRLDQPTCMRHIQGRPYPAESDGAEADQKKCTGTIQRSQSGTVGQPIAAGIRINTDAYTCISMHLYIFLCTYISELHRQCTCTYARTCSYIQPAVSAPHNRMYQPTTGFTSTDTVGCIVLVHHRLDQPRHACIASCL